MVTEPGLFCLDNGVDPVRSGDPTVPYHRTTTRVSQCTRVGSHLHGITRRWEWVRSGRGIGMDDGGRTSEPGDGGTGDDIYSTHWTDL